MAKKKNNNILWILLVIGILFFVTKSSTDTGSVVPIESYVGDNQMVPEQTTYYTGIFDGMLFSFSDYPSNSALCTLKNKATGVYNCGSGGWTDGNYAIAGLQCDLGDYVKAYTCTDTACTDSSVLFADMYQLEATNEFHPDKPDGIYFTDYTYSAELAPFLYTYSCYSCANAPNTPPNNTPPPSDDKSNTTLYIILGVVAVVVILLVQQTKGKQSSPMIMRR